MLRTVVTLLFVCVVAAVAGAVTTGMFWLTLVAVAGILGTGAVGLSMLDLRTEVDTPTAHRRAGLTLLAAGRGRPRGHVAHDGGEVGRAA
ncbi:hypothetical protein ACI784_22250 [Geodermatophilus sp. SYSU D01186]